MGEADPFEALRGRIGTPIRDTVPPHAVFASNNPAVTPNQDLQYFYDAAGNRSQTILNGLTTTYTTNNLNQYVTVGDTTYGYDLDGNLISQTTNGVTTTYTYNSQNQLIGVSCTSAP